MYRAELQARNNNPVRVGVVGVGRMGRGVVDQVATMPGMRVMAAADVDLGKLLDECQYGVELSAQMLNLAFRDGDARELGNAANGGGVNGHGNTRKDLPD